ncbi:MAG TPA: PASTA domain-containing protein [Gaiellaceae bacterium]|nr:PASTA domain-containing protein [Gaiellaceae bacterium]
MPSSRVALGSLCVLAVFLIGGALPAFASTTAPTPETAVQVPERLCAAAVPGHMACDAIGYRTRLVSSAEAKQLHAAGIARPTAPSSVGKGPAGGYSPSQLGTAYGVNPATATTQTVAIVDAYNDPSVTADLDAFDANYGLPAETSSSFAVVSQTGGSVSGINSDVGWAGEITLDVDAVRGLCHACKILLVETNSSLDTDLAAGVNYAAAHASIVSNSYGGPEFSGDAGVSAYDHPGVAILASSGDDGWYDWDVFNNGDSTPSAPQRPASFNTVIGVGGTTLNLNPDDSRASETVWNNNGLDDVPGQFVGALGAAGSGCSTLYTAQTWQQGVTGYSSLGCGATARNGVDVAADADPHTGYDTYETTGWCTTTDDNGNPCPGSDPGWETFGGTSLSSPLVAAMWALGGGPAGVKYPALTLYGHFQTSPSQFFDVTSGGNAYCGGDSATACSPGANPNQQNGELLDCMWGPTGTTVLTSIAQCNAQSGYDGVSGVGTLKSVTPFQPLSPTAVIQDPGAVDGGVAHTFSASGSTVPFPGDSISQYKWSWGDGTTTTTASVTTSHTYTSLGAKTVTLTVTDSDSSLNNGRTGSKSIQVSPQAVDQTLNVANAGSGAGSVSSSPAGIDCGATCSQAYSFGTVVTLTEAPASGSVFSGWSGACSGTGGCSVTMNQARSVTATFTLKPPPGCVVPNLKGKTLSSAKSALKHAHCNAGKVTKKFSKVKKGRVISQKPKAGTDLPAGSKVNLVLSKGKKR